MGPDFMLRYKLMIPGYRAFWRRRASVFLKTAHMILPDFHIGLEGGEPVAKRADGLVLSGLPSTASDRELFQLIGDGLPPGISQETFRLARDIVTRFAYPHLRPDIAPGCVDGEVLRGPAAQLAGFHGQHKDGVPHIQDVGLRGALGELFRPKPDDVILDCGAFLGFGEAAIAPMLTAGRVIALEANARNAALLERNVASAAPERATALHGAVWKTHGETLDLATGEAQANTLVQSVYDGGGRQSVPTFSVDGLVADQGVDRLTMLSLTVNGAELEALEGARRVLEAHRPRIRLAGWYRRDGRSLADLTRPILEAAGYFVHIGPREGVLAAPKERIS